MDPKPVTGLNVLKGTMGIVPDIGRILKGLYYLATAKADKFSSLGLTFERRAKQHPDKCFLRYEDTRYTYSEFNQWANQISHYYASLGIKSGDTVSLMMENRPETLVNVLAITKLGAIVSMINTTQRDDVLLHSFTVVEPKMIVIGEECIDAYESIRKNVSVSSTCKHFYMQDGSNNAAPEGYTDLNIAITSSSKDNPESTKLVQMKQPAYYIFTSGTTGLPKASILTHFRWVKAMGGFGLSAFRLRKDDNFYVCLPLYHNNALTVAWASIIGAGATMVLARKFSASGFWDDCRKYQVTACCYIGELCRYLLNQPPKDNDKDHSLRVMGGNGLRPDIWMEFRQRFGIHHIMELYGASECNIAFVNALNLDMTAGYCPLSFDVVEYDIEKDTPVLDDKGFMIPVEKGEVGLLIGEVTKRSPYEGYTNKKANISKVLTNVFKSGDSYFHSGDLVQKQGYGHVAFVDRLGDTFRWKGENVATTEVEEVANQFDQITESVVYGVQVPHTDGRAGMASITLNTELNNFDIKKFAEHVKAKLPSYAVPMFIRVSHEVEITGTFKHKKGDLKKQGFDLSLVDEPMFVLLPKTDEYQPVTKKWIEKLNAGEIQFQ
jgi:acyl-CoA synthetase (AMP-forming)/AMP-acid ligase II